MGGNVQMSVERAREYLKKWGMENDIRKFDVSSATVELAAQALNCEPKRIAKTLSFMIDDRCILIVTAGDSKIDNPKYKAEFGVKAKMLKAEEVMEYTGHEIGGVCPFGVKSDIKTYLDISLKRFKTVFLASGSSNSIIELKVSELEEISAAIKWIDVCKSWS
jgi:prolyl-tRNA editing enzyme YbaK/EbsC (Cys-tRNA(Pro) deacylase)